MNKDVWYKNPWVWLVIFFPVLAVVAGIATVIITNQNQPEMVVDDYYKKGKAINQDLAIYNKAKELGVELSIKIDQERILIKNNKKLPAARVQFIHSTLGKLDFELMLTPNGDGVLTALLEKSITGKWTVVVSAFDNSWKVKNKLALPYSDWVTL